MPNRVSAPDPPHAGPLEEIGALRRDLEGIEVPRRLWWTIRVRLFISALRRALPSEETLLGPGLGEHRLGIVPGQHRFGAVSGLHRIGLASAACLFVLAWVGLSGSIIDLRQAPKTWVEGKALAGVSARVQVRPWQPGLGTPLEKASQLERQTLAQGIQGGVQRGVQGTHGGVQGTHGAVNGVQVDGSALLPGGFRRGGSPDLVSIVGMESLAMLGLPYLGSGDLASSAATRSGEWITLPGGEVFALRLLD